MPLRFHESEAKHQEKMEGEHKKCRRKNQLEIPDMLGAKETEQRRCRFRWQ